MRKLFPEYTALVRSSLMSSDPANPYNRILRLVYRISAKTVRTE